MILLHYIMLSFNFLAVRTALIFKIVDYLDLLYLTNKQYIRQPLTCALTIQEHAPLNNATFSKGSIFLQLATQHCHVTSWKSFLHVLPHLCCHETKFCCCKLKNEHFLVTIYELWKRAGSLEKLEIALEILPLHILDPTAIFCFSKRPLV